MKHYEKIICIGIVLYFIATIICGAYLQYQLGQYRRITEQYRIELEAARNRQSELEQTIVGCSDILKRDRAILSESGTSIQFIRSQISAIRESYESMQDIINNGNYSSDKRRADNIHANTIEDNENEQD